MPKVSNIDKASKVSEAPEIMVEDINATETYLTDRSHFGQEVGTASEVHHNNDVEALQRALEDPNERKSQLCCACCCDLVKGVIIMNSIWVWLCISYIVLSLIDPNRLATNYGVVPLMEGDEVNPWAIVGFVKLGGGMICSLLGILGAARFHKYLVLTGAIWYVVYAITTLLDYESKRWIGAFLAAIFAYPSFHLFISMHKGNITRETYAREAHCCGGSKGRD